MYDFYISKHKKLKITGWILIGAGVAAMGVGAAIINNSSLFSENSDDYASGGILVTAGALTAAASIPVFIVSGSNKRKANTILGTGEIGIGYIPFNDTRHASVGIKINF